MITQGQTGQKGLTAPLTARGPESAACGAATVRKSVSIAVFQQLHVAVEQRHPGFAGNEIHRGGALSSDAGHSLHQAGHRFAPDVDDLKGMAVQVQPINIARIVVEGEPVALSLFEAQPSISGKDLPLRWCMSYGRNFGQSSILIFPMRAAPPFPSDPSTSASPSDKPDDHCGKVRAIFGNCVTMKVFVPERNFRA